MKIMKRVLAISLSLLCLSFTACQNKNQGQDNISNITTNREINTKEKYALFHDGLVPIKQGDLWGYLNEDGEIAIEPQFEDALPFSEGLAGVCVDGNWGYIDTQGKIVIEPVYACVSDFSEGIASVCPVVLKAQYIDKNGTVLFNQDFSTDIYSTTNSQVGFGVGAPFHNGTAFVEANAEDGYKIGVIDTTGNYITEPQFDDILLPINFDKYETDLFPVRNDEFKWGYVDEKGNLIIEFQFDAATLFSDGLAEVRLGDAVYFIDQKGNTKITSEHFSYNLEEEFSSGLAHISYDDTVNHIHERRIEYMDKNGDIVYEFLKDEDNDSLDCTENKAGIKTNSLWGYIDATGDTVIDSKYENAGQFIYGKAWVQYGGRWQCIDAQGNPLFTLPAGWSPKNTNYIGGTTGGDACYGNTYYRDGTLPFFADGYSIIKIENGYIIIDEQGKQLGNLSFSAINNANHVYF